MLPEENRGFVRSETRFGIGCAAFGHSFDDHSSCSIIAVLF